MIGSYSGPAKHVNRDASMPARIAEVATDSRPFCCGQCTMVRPRFSRWQRGGEAPIPTPPHPFRCPRRRGRSCTPARGPGCGRSRTPPRPAAGRWGRCPGRSPRRRGRGRRGGNTARRGGARRWRRSSSSQVNGGPSYPRSRANGRHVVGRVRQTQHVVADEIARRRLAETPVVVLRRDDGELFDDVPVEPTFPISTLQGLPQSATELPDVAE